MKVEFQPTEYGVGMEVYVPAAEFNRAARDEDEFRSLAASVHAFSLSCGIRYLPDRVEYEQVRRWLEPEGGVVFTVCVCEETGTRWREIHVVKGSRRRKVFFSTDGGMTDSMLSRPQIRERSGIRWARFSDRRRTSRRFLYAE